MLVCHRTHGVTMGYASTNQLSESRWTPNGWVKPWNHGRSSKIGRVEKRHRELNMGEYDGELRDN